jgi:hypothetical protein
MRPNTSKKSPRLLTTYLAAVYVLMFEGHTTYFPDDLTRAKARVYNLARDGKITRHGGSDWGSARWDVQELDSALRDHA